MKLMRVLLSCLLCACLCLPAVALAEYYPDSAYAETPIDDDSYARICNIQLAAEALDGWAIGWGERFSFNEAVGERTREAGYRTALNGRGARVVGGGVSQVATTLFLAAEDFEWVEVEPFSAYGDKFTGTYVDDGDLAVITDYDAGYDFAFTSWYPGTLVVEAWVQDDTLCCALTGYYVEQSSRLIASSATPLPQSEAQKNNIRLSAWNIDGCWLDYGGTFSFNGLVGPRTGEAGYVSATNGRGVKVIGGGVAQTAATVYLAVKNLESVTLDSVRTYGERFTGDYVSDPADAIVTDYRAGIDFAFTWYGAGSLLISVYDDGDWLYCDVYEYSE